MNPNGLVRAASMTSQTSMFICRHISASSFTRPILTARNVFSSKLHHLGDARRGDADDRRDDLLIQRRRDIGRILVDAADDLRRVAGVPLGVCGIHALGREGQEEVAARDQAAALQHWPHHFFRRSRIGRGFEHDELAGAQVVGDLFDGGDDVRKVGVLRFPQRRRHADADGVRVGEHGEVGGRVEASGLDQRRQPIARNVRDIGNAAADGVDFRDVEIDGVTVRSSFGELHRERETDVTEADDTNPRLFGWDAFDQMTGTGRLRASHR